MTTFRRVLFLAPCFGLLAALAGCSPQPVANADSTPTPEQPKVVLAPQQPVAAVTNPDANAKPQPQPQPKVEPPAPPPPTFTFPADLGGKAVAKAVTPDVTRPLPHKKTAGAPLPRVAPSKLLNPDAVTVASHVPPPLLPAKPAGFKPTPPAEKVPLSLGEGADGVPVKPVFPVAAVDTPRARDVNLPPPAPKLGRPATDRVPFDDPTADIGNAAVAADSVKVPLASSSFLKAVVPDPFELGAQVKPKVPPTAEPSPAPVTVNPQRLK